MGMKDQFQDKSEQWQQQAKQKAQEGREQAQRCLLYTSPSPRDS